MGTPPELLLCKMLSGWRLSTSYIRGTMFVCVFFVFIDVYFLLFKSVYSVPFVVKMPFALKVRFVRFAGVYDSEAPALFVANVLIS